MPLTTSANWALENKDSEAVTQWSPFCALPGGPERERERITFSV